MKNVTETPLLKPPESLSLNKVNQPMSYILIPFKILGDVVIMRVLLVPYFHIHFVAHLVFMREIPVIVKCGVRAQSITSCK